MEKEKNTKFMIVIIIAIVGFIGMLTFLVLYVGERGNNNVLTHVSEEQGLVTDQALESTHEISVQVGSDELFLWPTEYTIRYGNDSYGPISNISLPGSPFRDQWFKKTTDENIVGVIHFSDTFTGLDERVFLKPREKKAIHLYRDILSLTGDVTFYSPTFMNDWPISYNISIDLKDEVCSSVPEDIYMVEPSEEDVNPVERWIDDCNASYPLSVSQILVNDQVAFELPLQKVIRVPGVFDGQVAYNAANEDGVALHNGRVGLALRGVSAELDHAYFIFLDEIYSIDRDGIVEHHEVAGPMVDMTNEPYE
ncbi:hypothetical protein KJ758_03630 [Patescibacteria group bacterium]|nr:hypothetical protein [Patescibacteria group bacterium]